MNGQENKEESLSDGDGRENAVRRRGGGCLQKEERRQKEMRWGIIGVGRGEGNGIQGYWGGCQRRACRGWRYSTVGGAPTTQYNVQRPACSTPNVPFVEVPGVAAYLFLHLVCASHHFGPSGTCRCQAAGQPRLGLQSRRPSYHQPPPGDWLQAGRVRWGQSGTDQVPALETGARHHRLALEFNEGDRGEEGEDEGGGCSRWEREKKIHGQD